MRVVLAVDGSDYSQAAVDQVVHRPWPPGTTIRVLSAIQPYTPPMTEVVVGATIEQVTQQLLQDAKQLTERTARALAATGAAIETAVRQGDPREAIVDEAQEWGADLIVMGSHGRTGLKRWVLGSVAQAVAAHARCSVEIVRRPPAA